MKAKIAELIAALRRAELPVSVAEAMDAAQAAALVGVARPVLRDALAATLVKDEAHRPTFLAAFDATFPARARATASPGRRGRRGAGMSSGGEPGGESARAAGDSAAGMGAKRRSLAGEPTASDPSRTSGSVSDAPAPEDAYRDRPTSAGDEETRDRSGGERSPNGRAERGDACQDGHAAGEERRDGDDVDGASATRARLDRERRLRGMPFRAMNPADIEASTELARAIAARVTARVRRRLAPKVSGRLDFRRTIRAAVPRGGIPFERRYRNRRPGAPDLVALCDLSASTATATGFFLAVLAPAAVHFRRVRLFGFVDRLVEIEFVAGQVRPAAPLDLMARSDFGRVLRDLVEEEATALTPDTVLLVLGDARNNRRPPRADLLAAVRAKVRRALWLNPDPRERWNTGDSVMAAYAKHVDAVVACGSLADLERALGAVARW